MRRAWAKLVMRLRLPRGAVVRLDFTVYRKPDGSHDVVMAQYARPREWDEVREGMVATCRYLLDQVERGPAECPHSHYSREI